MGTGTKEQERQWHKNYRDKQKEKVYNHYWIGKCSCEGCNETNKAFMCVDHVNGDGNKHRATADPKLGMLTGWRMHIWLVKNDYPDGFQILCYNCNHSKSILGRCAHLP